MFAQMMHSEHMQMELELVELALPLVIVISTNIKHKHTAVIDIWEDSLFPVVASSPFLSPRFQK